MSRYKYLIVVLCLATTFLAIPALAGTPEALPDRSLGTSLVFGGRPADAAKTVVVDTQLIIGPWGSGAPYNGQFETPGGSPAWNGWTSEDLTQSDVSHWHVDTYHVVSGTYSAWCGDASFVSCGETDPDAGGYGNRWDEILEWRGAVTNPALATNLTITATVNHDSEPGYDYSYVSVVQGGATNNLWSADGAAQAVPLNLVTAYLPVEYEGLGQNEIVVQFRFTSDGGWSDEDCGFATAGAIQVDDVVISLDNGLGYSHDFEDGTLGDFNVVFPPGVGDFAQVWTGLRVLPGFDAGNTSPKVAFIDDGLVVPGTGGTNCITWCYGPEGYIVNNTGGLAGPAAHIHNSITSPVMAWPDPTYDGGDLAFDAWRHESLAADSPGVFFTWGIRATDSVDSADLTTETWLDRNFVYYGGPDWFRQINVVSDLTTPNTRWVQVQLAVYELGWAWGWRGLNGTPAPYFDNVRLTAYPFHGPTMSAIVTKLPHDTFPESGTLDLVNLAANNIRFDMGRPQNNNDLANTPGDSVVIAVTPQRSGAVLTRPPRLYWSLQRNHLFDGSRSSGLPDQGYVEGWPVMNAGTPVPDNFAFDLPDSGFLFPGDFLYYYFEARDVKDGEVQTVTMPADTTGFSNFDDPMAYPPIYKLHALPSLRDNPGQPSLAQPEILFWDDASAVGNRDEWYLAFANLGLVAGNDYDIYYTNDPSEFAGHGLGGRSTALQLAGYNELIYTSGVVTGNTLSDMNITTGTIDYGDDIGVISAWLEQGGKDMLLTGDDLAGDLARSGGAKSAFLNNWMGVDLLDENVMALIGPQTEPMVLIEATNPVIQTADQWHAVGTSLSISSGYYGGGSTVTGTKRYDGVTVRPGAQRLAEFTDPVGFPGAYSFSAATLNVRTDFNARIISFPYDFQSIWTAQSEGKIDAPLPARTQILADILNYFGQGGGTPSDVPDALAFGVHHYPNPFNPMVTISYTMPREGHLSVKVFDVRGRLVDTVADGRREMGPGEVQWDGRTTSGEAAAAGVYFYEARAGEDVVIGKMALIK
jgi:hypothetical protein